MCDLANASESCVAGVCTLDLCDAGFVDCDLDPATGCEADLDAVPQDDTVTALNSIPIKH